tara:strand:- start:9451 stop:9648 length:198 start_codon:yes stop_codon:yes gene_type:complete
MENLQPLIVLLIAAQVATVYFITRSHVKAVEEFRKVLLEREETERYYYTITSTDPDTDNANLEVA